MSEDQQFIRVIYILRRPIDPTDDPRVIINTRKTIQKVFKDVIAPFDPHTYNLETFENSGLRIRIDKHDLNSFRIDVNLKEEEGKSAFEMLANPMLLAFDCLHKIKKANWGKDVKCYISFELVEVK